MATYKSTQDNKTVLPTQFLERYVRTRLKQPDENLPPSTQVIERGGKSIIIEPVFKTENEIVFFPRDPQHLGEMTFSIQSKGGNIIVTQGGKGTQNIPLTSRYDLEGRIGQIHGLIASYTVSSWQTAERDNNNLTLEWQFPNATQLPPQIMFQAREKYIHSEEIIGRKHRRGDFTLGWENVGGLSRPRRTLEGMIVDIENPNLSQQAGTPPYGEKIFIVSGDNKTGKTSLIRATATELQKRVASRGGFTFYYFDCGSDIQEYGMFVGDALNSVIKAVQDDVKSGRTALIHIDNLDAL